MLSFRHVPETIKISATTETQFDLDKLTVQLENFIPIDGNKQNSLQFHVPASNAIKWEHDGTNLENRAVLFARGYIIKGLASK